jgi:hypothetical protein
VNVPAGMNAKSLLSGTDMMGGAVTLPKYGVAVLEIKAVR